MIATLTLLACGIAKRTSSVYSAEEWLKASDHNAYLRNWVKERGHQEAREFIDALNAQSYMDYKPILMEVAAAPDMNPFVRFSIVKTMERLNDVDALATFLASLETGCNPYPPLESITEQWPSCEAQRYLKLVCDGLYVPNEVTREKACEALRIK